MWIVSPSTARTCGTVGEYSRRLLKKAVQQGRSERRSEGVPLGYVEGLSDARTLLADFFSILLATKGALSGSQFGFDDCADGG